MLYILDQRLKAQNIPPEKSQKGKTEIGIWGLSVSIIGSTDNDDGHLFSNDCKQ